MATSTEQTADVLRRRLATAEEDTQQLMQQLEEMGFSTTKDKIAERRALVETNSSQLKTDLHSYSEQPAPSIYSDQQQLISPAPASDFDCQSKDSQASSLSEKHATERPPRDSKSAKYKPITPFSLRGLSIPGLMEGGLSSNSKATSQSGSMSWKGSESKGKRKQRSESTDQHNSVGRQELEEELIRMKRIISHLEEEVEFESEAKVRAKEEVEKLKSYFDDATKTRTELEMKIEDLTSVKQKLTRRVSEQKEELTREASLRSSLEESHKTLLSRLQDMESVIENLRSEEAEEGEIVLLLNANVQKDIENKTNITSSANLKAELVKAKDELSEETIKRQRIEENYHLLITEKDRLLLSVNVSQSENLNVSQDLARLQSQYTELINQLQEAQKVTEALKGGKNSLEEEKSILQSKVQSLNSDLEHFKTNYEDAKESVTRLSAEKNSLESDFCQMKIDKDKAEKIAREKKNRLESLEIELKTVKKSLAQKNQEFSSAADGLEMELAGLKTQLEAMESEKQHVLKDKESLLEEVNQTVDTLMVERSRLQTELQASCVEAESLRATCTRLEQDKAQMLERLGSLQHHQNTQQKVETALTEMVEAKNKLAYENGRLQSTIHQLQLELEQANREQGDSTQLRKLSQSLQAKYTQGQQEISEYKISLQRAESQARSAMEQLHEKDMELKIATARRDEMEKELDKLTAHLEVLEGRETQKVHSYQKSMEDAKVVNQEMAGTLEAVMASHSQLQNIVENLQVELGKRDSQLMQYKASRNKDVEDVRTELADAEIKIETLKAELRREKDKNGKRSNKDVAEFKKQNDNLHSRNQELVKLNTELRQRAVDKEKDIEDLKMKLSTQRHKLEYLHRAKKQLEDNLNKMKAVREDIEELEQMRNEYTEKNQDQADTIAKFIAQISCLQDELRQLAQAHSNTQDLLRLKEDALEKERRVKDEMRKKYAASKRRETDMPTRTHSSDEKLKEVRSESLEISKHLQEAHDWFRGKFDKLQTELTTSKQTQAKLAKENEEQRRSLEEERNKAQDAAERAKEMIQNSRQTISKLADYAEIADADTKHQLAKLRAGLHAGNYVTKQSQVMDSPFS